MSTLNFIKVKSWQCQALTPRPVSIEVLRSRGLNQLVLTGLPDAWLRDSRDKLRALVSSHVPWGALERVLVHLLPADEHKNGAHLEFAIVVACILSLMNRELPEAARALLDRCPLVGSLTLEGKLQHTELSQVLERADPSHTLGPSRFRTLSHFLDFLFSGAGVDSLPPLPAQRDFFSGETEDSALPVIVVERHWQRFWLLTAAVAEMPVLLMGPPGGGKSHLAKWAAQIVPSGEVETAFQIHQIWNLAGKPPPLGAPVLSPHSRTHLSEFMGVNKKGIPRPGIFSLAHGGTLILDEFFEMNRDCREILRTILDKKVIEKQNAMHTVDWPADFWLVTTSNPCPCGYSRGDDLTRCQCPDVQRKAYKCRLSGPLLDRLGLKLFVSADEAVEHKKKIKLSDWFDPASLEESPESLRALVKKSRARRQDFFIPAREAIALMKDYTSYSERERQNKIRLLAALGALTGRPMNELKVALYCLGELEEGLFRMAPPHPPLLPAKHAVRGPIESL